MPFARPSPQEIRDRVSAEIVRASGGAGALMRRSLEWVLARMVAIAGHELHGHLAWAARQVFPDTADREELDRHAGIWGVQRSPATRARGQVVFRGSAGSSIAAGTELRRGDDVRFTVDATVVIAANRSTVIATVTAMMAGAAGNTGVEGLLQIVAPIAGVQSRVTIQPGGLSGGVEGEDDASLRVRVIARVQEPPHGGARHDYRAWVRAVVGDTLVWTFPNQLGPGSVVVFFVSPDGSIPAPATVNLVQAHVDEVRPVTASVSVLAPTVEPLAVRLRIVPDTVEVRATVTAALGEMIMREAEPGGTLALSRISAAISAASGEYSHRLVQPAADVQVPFGRIFRLGSVEWIV